MSSKAYYLSPEGRLQRDLSEEDIRATFQSGQGLLWVDISDNTEEDGEFLARVFGFHPLAIEDCLSKQIHPPKIDDFGSYIFMIVHGVNYTVQSDIVETTELAIFAGPNFVVSSHDVPLYSIQSVARLVESDGRPMRRGADFLAYALLDALVDNVMPTVDAMSDVTEDIEEEVIENPQQSTLEAILKLKRSIMRLHRVMAPQSEVMNRLSRSEFSIIGEEAGIFYRDVYDHIVRIEDLGQTIRDRADNALATHLSSVANRQNETMRILSIVATIFLPLGLLAGIYGMNFEHIPELGWHWGYFAVIGFIGAAIVTILWFLWVRSWIARSRRRVVKLKLFRVEPQKLPGYVGDMLMKPRLGA